MVSTTTLFYTSFALYIFLYAGSFYDFIQSPPAMGSNPNGKPIAILLHHVNRQYIIEGMAAALMVFLASLGAILITSFGKPVTVAVSNAGSRRSKSTKRWKPEFQQYVLLGFGVLLFVVGYNVLTVFLHIKIPRYLHGDVSIGWMDEWMIEK